ncbi:MAG: NHL repeat-containing protein [Thermodesulfobacteriota bacterium]
MSLKKGRRKSAVWITAFSISLVLLAAREASAFQIVAAAQVAVVEAEMRMPTDASFGDSGALYVLDGYQNRIVVRNPSGRIRILTPEATCRLDRPLGITVNQGKIYVADTGNHRICELDGEGRCLRSITLRSKEPEVPFLPTDIAIEGASVVVVDRGGNCIHLCLYPSFEQDKTFGNWGEKGGVLNNPYLVAFGRGGIFLTDMMNGRLVHLTEGGMFLNDLRERGVREGQFIRPKGVAVGSGNQVFVSDSTLGVVQVFDTEFQYRGTLGSDGKPRRFQHPAGLAVYENLLAVVEQRRNAVTVLKIQSP